MNKTIHEVMADIENEKEYLLSNAMIENVEKMNDKVVDMHKIIHMFQSMSLRISDIANSITFIINYRKSTSNSKNRTRFYETEPNKQDYAYYYDKIKKVQIVENESDIKNGEIYYINQTDQYAININGFNIKGNICDWSNYPNDKNLRCNYDDKCVNNSCYRYHPSRKEKRILNDNSRNVLKVRGRNTINSDIKNCDLKKEINNRTDFLMHDLIILIELLRIQERNI